MTHPAHPTNQEVRSEIDEELRELCTKISNLEDECSEILQRSQTDFGPGVKKVVDYIDIAIESLEVAYDSVKAVRVVIDEGGE